MANARVAKQGSRDITLDSLLLPDTTDEVRDLYYGFEEEAKSVEFGPLEDGVIVLDTETTGLSFSDCELIEIAAARLSGREVVERFETFVHPRGPIPKEIQRLTHITDLDVRDAPSAEEAVYSLAEFVGGAPILAHNATFDRNFVEKVRGGNQVSDFWIDTLALSRIALPRLSSHRLADMARAFHCESVTHRAGDDVDALCGMWRIILCGLKALPDGLLGFLADLYPDVEWSFRPVLSYVASMQEGGTFDLKGVRKALTSGRTYVTRKDAATLTELQAPTSEEVESYFVEGGPLDSAYDHYERRNGQVELALEVRDALESSTHRVLEAGTGIGKSLGYLIPEVLYAQRNDITIGIATKTNALTDQLISHDLPIASSVIPGGVTYYSLKGYDHYPCLLRMDHTARQGLETDGVDKPAAGIEDGGTELLTALSVSYAFACQSIDGDLDALGIRWKVVPRDKIVIAPNDCVHNRCPYYPNECFVHGARRRAASADVVVTNHAFLLRDIASDNALLPPIRNWVIDEAHGLEEEARRQWETGVSGDYVAHVLETVGDSKSGLIRSLLVQTAALDGETLAVSLLSKAGRMADMVRESFGTFFADLHNLSNLSHNRGEYGSSTLWIDSKVRESDQWHTLSGSSAKCVEQLDALTSALKGAQDSLCQDSPHLSAQIQGPVRRLQGIRDAIQLIVFDDDAAFVYSAVLYRQRKYIAREKLVAQLVDVGEELESSWLSQMQSVVFTSATLSVSGGFRHFDHSVGLDLIDNDRHKDLSLRSEYDFDRCMAIVVAEDMPQPNDKAYLPSLGNLLYDIHTGMDGSVLTLFTNRKEMEAVYRDLAPRLAEDGLTLMVQERGSSPRRLRQKFISNESVSLFALKSFWEGFDASGDTLRCVVIPKLPFANPNDPLVRERDRRDRRSWWNYSLPDAILSVKQAAGRLIRSSDDVGIVVLADSRIVKKRYGQQVLDSLPSHNRILLGRHNVGRYIRIWRQSKGR